MNMKYPTLFNYSKQIRTTEFTFEDELNYNFKETECIVESCREFYFKLKQQPDLFPECVGKPFDEIFGCDTKIVRILDCNGIIGWALLEYAKDLPILGNDKQPSKFSRCLVRTVS